MRPMTDDPHTPSATEPPPMPGLASGVVRVVDGPDRGLTKDVGGTPLVVGRAADCDLVLADRRVSQRHVAITLAPRGFLVRDLDSHHGTWFEGSRVREVVVPPGALLRVGTVHLLLGAPPEALRIRPSERTSFGELVGSSLAMRRVFTLLERAAQCDVTVLLEGETGTGKEVAARALHAESARAARPFVSFDGGGAHPGLLRAALFGYAEGSSTGAATGGRAGLFEAAAGGTVFLGEIGEIPLALQPALRRVCDERTIQRVGSTTPVPVDVRLVAATNRDLAAEVAAGHFREDLYYRVHVLPIALPPLRARVGDVPLLCEQLFRQVGAAVRGPLEGPGLAALMQHDWGGNGRELRQVLRRALANAGPQPTFTSLAFALEPAAGRPPGAGARSPSFQEDRTQAVAQFEHDFLTELLAATDGNVRRASRASGIERTQLGRLVRKHGLR
jgi:transcriptional regulator with PAS, ATPase and Fis domain